MDTLFSLRISGQVYRIILLINQTGNLLAKQSFFPSPPRTLTHTEPTVLNWDWNPGSDVSDTVGLLVIIDSQEIQFLKQTKKYSI